MLRIIKGSAGHSRCTYLYALLNNFDFLRIEYTAVQRCARKSILNLLRDQRSLARAGGDGIFLSETGFHV